MFISVSTLKKYDLIVLVYPVIIFLSLNIVETPVPIITENAFLFTIVIFVGIVLGGMPQIIYNSFSIRKKILLKKTKLANLQKTLLKQNNPKFEFVKPVFAHSSHLFTIMMILGFSLANMIILYSQPILIRSLDNPQKACSLFNVFFMILFAVVYSKVILHEEIFIHHYISFIFLVLGIFGLYMHTVAFDQFVYTAPYYFLFSLIYMLPYAYLKVLMLRKYIQPLSVAFYFGAAGLVFCGLAYLICYCGGLNHPLTIDILNIGEAFRVLFNSWSNVGWFILVLFIHFLNTLGTFSLMYYYNPVTEATLYHNYMVFSWIYRLAANFNLAEFFCSLIGSILSVLGILIYVEIITINKFGLNKNTREEIRKRSAEDIAQITLIEIEEPDEEWQIIENE